MPDVLIKAKIQAAPIAVKPKKRVKSIQEMLDEAVLVDQQEQLMEQADELKGQLFQLPPSAKISYVGFINRGVS